MNTNKKILNTSVEKAFKILNCFTPSVQELGVTEIAHKMSTNKSAVYRMLATMVALDVIQQNPENDKYRLGLKISIVAKVSYVTCDSMYWCGTYKRGILHRCFYL